MRPCPRPIGTSVGVAVHDVREGTSAEELLRHADAAMYRHEERTATPRRAHVRGGTLRRAGIAPRTHAGGSVAQTGPQD